MPVPKAQKPQQVADERKAVPKMNQNKAVSLNPSPAGVSVCSFRSGRKGVPLAQNGNKGKFEEGSSPTQRLGSKTSIAHLHFWGKEGHRCFAPLSQTSMMSSSPAHFLRSFRFKRNVLAGGAGGHVQPGAKPTPGISGLLLPAIATCFCAWMLSLPSFPTTDGPVHMYYVHVLGSLLSHRDVGYAHFFRIRHLLPPYSLYYYALLALSGILPMLLADRIIVCLYFVSFIFGFRFLARQIGKSADLMTLLATPLLLNWPLGMGFVNFCLSLSFSFWATGLWLKVAGTRNVWGRIGFLALVTGIMLTHPVPLLLLLAVTGALLLARLIEATREAGRWALPAHGVADLVTLGLAALNVGYVKLFANGNPLKQVNETEGPPPSFWKGVLQQATICPREHALAFVFGRRPDILVYRVVLLSILVLAITLAVLQFRRNRRGGAWRRGDTFLLLGAGLFFVLPFIPPQLNGLYFFADRLVICVWLAFLLAASGWSGHPGPVLAAPETFPGHFHAPNGIWLACASIALVGDVTLLTSANRILRPIAQNVAKLDRGSLGIQGQVGFMMEDPRPMLGEALEGPSWNPYHWALMHAFRHNDAVIANAPWMHESIIPVAPSAALPAMSIAALREPFANEVQRDLLRSPGDLRQTLTESSFFLVNQVDRTALTTGEPVLLQAGSAAREWSCKGESWYRVCKQATGATQTAQSQPTPF